MRSPRAAGLAAPSRKSRPLSRARARRIPLGLAQGSPREDDCRAGAGPLGSRSRVGEAPRRADVHLRERDPAGLVRSGRRPPFEEGAWIIPFSHPEGGREHRVPICWHAWEILNESWALGRGGSIVSASTGRKPVPSPALSELLRELIIAAVHHPLQPPFRT